MPSLSAGASRVSPAFGKGSFPFHSRKRSSDGSFETCALLAKRALLRALDRPHPDPRVAGLEKEMLNRVNALGIGPQGFGGQTTALAVMVEEAPCHIAALPVAVNVECHSHRHGSLTLKGRPMGAPGR